MRKFLILSLIFFTTDSFASGIASNTNSAPCTNNTLETYSGNSNLSADWQPNEIQLRWYNGNTQITPTNTTANTCIYDGTLAIPTNAPSRTGYTFAGWEVVPQYDLSTLPVNQNGEYAYNKTPRYCWSGSNGTQTKPCDNGDFDDLNYHEWKVRFDYGMVYGFGACSSTVGTTVGEVNTPDTSSNDGYCWCKVTGFIPANSNIKYAPLKTPRWGFALYLGISTCAEQCADFCSARFLKYQNLRQSLYN